MILDREYIMALSPFGMWIRAAIAYVRRDKVTWQVVCLSALHPKQTATTPLVCPPSVVSRLSQSKDLTLLLHTSARYTLSWLLPGALQYSVRYLAVKSVANPLSILVCDNNRAPCVFSLQLQAVEPLRQRDASEPQCCTDNQGPKMASEKSRPPSQPPCPMTKLVRYALADSEHSIGP